MKAWLGSCGVRYCSDHTQVFVRIQSLPGRLLGASLNCMWASLVVPYALVPTSPFLLQKILFMISSVHILACTSKTRVRLKKKKQCALKHPVCLLNGISGANFLFKELHSPGNLCKKKNSGVLPDGFLHSCKNPDTWEMASCSVSPGFTMDEIHNHFSSLCPCCLLCVYCFSHPNLELIPSRTPWGSWAQNPFCDPHFLTIENRLHSASKTFP